MQFSLRLNNDLVLGDYITLAQVAEEIGFSQFWVSNDLFLRSASVILPAVVQATERIEIGTGILNPYTINPAEIAMFAATMDELSGNRFNLGLAAGAGDFLRWVGLEQEKPLAAIGETITVVRQLLTGERAALEGEFLRWGNDAYLRFEPQRVTPIYVGAMGPKMLRLCGERADGVLPLLFPPEHYFGVKPLVDEGARRRSEELGAPDLAACIWVSLSEDAEAARTVLAQKIAYYGHALSPLILERLDLQRSDFEPIEKMVTVERDMAKGAAMVDDRMLRIGVMGRPRDVIERLEPLVEAGAQHLSFGPPLGPDPMKAVRLLGDVIAYFQNA